MTHHYCSQQLNGRYTPPGSRKISAPHKRGAQHLKDVHGHDEGRGHTHRSAQSKEREIAHHQENEQPNSSKRPPLHPGRERNQGKLNERSRATIFDHLGKNGLQKDLWDVLTDKRKAQGGGESPATIEIRDDKPGENTRPGGSEKETSPVSPVIQTHIDSLAATTQGLRKMAQPAG